MGTGDMPQRRFWKVNVESIILEPPLDPPEMKRN